MLAALEGAFVLCRAQRAAEPMLAAGKMAAAHVAAFVTGAAADR